MATITYNGVSISNCKIARLNVENEFEGESFVRTGRKHTMEGTGVIFTSNPVTTIASIKNDLNKPRKRLTIQFEGQSAITLADGWDGADSKDAKNGPMPAVNVTEITGSNPQAFVIGFTFNWFECGEQAVQRCEMVQTHSINEEGLLRVQRRGFLRLSAACSGFSVPTESANPAPLTTHPIAVVGNYAASAVSGEIDFWRGVVAGFPVVGFQRTKQEFYVQPDQQTLVFDIEDTQLVNPLPLDILSGDGSFEYERSLPTGGESNIMGTKRFRVELVGRPTMSKRDIYVNCVNIALTRIRFTGARQDFVQSIKITEPSLFKRNAVVFEVVAMGMPAATQVGDPNLGSTDEWLYKYIFSRPASLWGGSAVTPYGDIGQDSPKAQFSQVKNYDSCVLGGTWQAITASETGTVVTQGGNIAPEGQFDTTPFKPSQGTDSLMQEQAKDLLHFKANQSMKVMSNIDLMDTMGGDVQSGFQFAVPQAVVVQTVDMVTRSPSMAIPWPYLDDQYVVIGLDVTTNDAAPDASGNPIFAIHAVRTLRVNVSMSTNAWVGTAQGPDDRRTTRIVNYFPNGSYSARNPITGFASVDLRANVNGSAQNQGFASGMMLNGGSGGGGMSPMP